MEKNNVNNPLGSSWQAARIQFPGHTSHVAQLSALLTPSGFLLATF